MLERRNKILIVEPVDALATVYCKNLEAAGHIALSIGSVANAVEAMKSYDYDVIMADGSIGKFELGQLIKNMQHYLPESELVVLVQNTDDSLSQYALKRGAFDYLMKPIAAERMITTVRNALGKIALSKAVHKLEEHENRDSLFNLVGGSAPMQAVYQAVKTFACQKDPVLIQGGNGIGKVDAAEAIHLSGMRADNPFINFDCHEYSDEDIQATYLFGTPPDQLNTRSVIGKLRQADRGTLLIENVEFLTLKTQRALVNFMNTDRIPGMEKLGSMSICDVRLIFASTSNLRTLVEDGTVDEDFYVAIQANHITLPELMSRKEDIEMIANHFLKLYSQKLDKRIVGFSENAMKIIAEKNWGGQVQQLKNYVHMLASEYNNGVITQAMLLDSGACALKRSSVERPAVMAQVSDSGFGSISPKTCSLDEIERWVIESRIKEFKGSIPKAAASLGISPSTIYRKREGWVASLQQHAVA